MALRLANIKVNRGGPLTDDFAFEPGDLNLIYGRNETGKTYIVESLIRFLFQTGRGASLGDGLRGWSVGGKAVITGLEQNPVSFTVSGRKLENYWEEGAGLSRLLVVRAGETQLRSGELDGVGRDILKDVLSGKGILDAIAGKISVTLRKATIEESEIVGNQTGELKSRSKAHDKLVRRTSLLEEVEETYATGDAYRLRRSKEQLEDKLDRIQKARRYHAGRLARKIEELSEEKREVPSDGDLSRLEADVESCEKNRASIDTQEQKLAALESSADDFRWATEALSEYVDLTSVAPGALRLRILLLLASLSIVGSAALGLLGHRLPLFGAAVLALVLLGLSYLDARKGLATARESEELKRIRATYRSRFGDELTDRAQLRAKVEEMTAEDVRAGELRTAVEALTGDAVVLERKITETLRAWTGREHTGEEWRDVTGRLRIQRAELDDSIDGLREKLISVGVSEDDYLDEDPGEAWRPERHAELARELDDVTEDLESEDRELGELKARVSQETDLGAASWEALISRLRELCEETREECRAITAEILAKIQVHAVVEELRHEENTRIASGLTRKELTGPLRALTGRYGGIRLDADEGLILISDDDDEYPLSAVSTGTQEQTFLALRIGFASIAMAGSAGFFILDDAFQHSDWKRRERLVKQSANLAENGWQIFYFAMDDHIRDLFEAAGKPLGDRFRSHSL